MLARVRGWFGQPQQAKVNPVGVSAPMRAEPVEVTDGNFDQIVLGADQPVIVDFWADWCQPCTIMSAYMGFLVQEFGESLLVAALDVEENAVTSEKYEVQGLPTLIMFLNGTEIDRQMGVVGYDELRSRVEQLVASS